MKLYLSVKEKATRAIAAGVAEGFALSVKQWESVVTTNTPNKKSSTPQKDFNGLYDVVNPLYTSLAQVPAYWKDEVAAMMKSGVIKGDGKNEIAIRKESFQSVIIAYLMIQNK